MSARDDLVNRVGGLTGYILPGSIQREMDDYVAAIRSETLNEAADLAAPTAPDEVSYFGDFGQDVARWLRMISVTRRSE